MWTQFFSNGDDSSVGEDSSSVGSLAASESIRVVQAAQSHTHEESSSTRVAFISMDPEKKIYL